MRLSDGLLDGRVARCRAGATSERAARRPGAGFWRADGRFEGDQELRKRLAHAGGVSANAWHHLAVTMRDSNRQVTIYIDDVQRAQGMLSSDSASGNSAPIRIGRNGDNSDNFWNGKVDDMRIWNVVQMAAEISANDQAELSSATTGLIANWKLNDGTGTTATDSAGTARNATLVVGAAWSTEVHPKRIRH